MSVFDSKIKGLKRYVGKELVFSSSCFACTPIICMYFSQSSAKTEKIDFFDSRLLRKAVSIAFPPGNRLEYIAPDYIKKQNTKQHFSPHPIRACSLPKQLIDQTDFHASDVLFRRLSGSELFLKDLSSSSLFRCYPIATYFVSFSSFSLLEHSFSVLCKNLSFYVFEPSLYQTLCSNYPMVFRTSI